MKRRSGAEVAIYGNTSIQRRYCHDCTDWALVVQGRLTCCKQPSSAVPKRFKRESEPWWKRKSPPRRHQLAEQEGRCFYCENALGGCILRRGVPVRLQIHWDHKVPYAYNADNRPRNFVAACHVCNILKRDLIFQTVEEAKVWLANKRADKGYL